MGARPKCAKDQGRIFDTANKSTKYAHWRSSSYGDADGLLGINCRHQIYPFVDGVNTQTYFPYDQGENAKAYKLSQQQRQLERNVRSSKRECTSLDTLGDKDGFEKSSVKLKAQEAKLKSFCSDNDLPYQSDRTAVSGYNRSVSAKAVAANNARHKQWLKDIGAETTNLNTLDKYYESKYNNDTDYNLLLGYNKAVQKGDISPLIGFDLYNSTATQIDEELLGIKLTNGIEVEKYTTHFIDRVLGQVSESKKGKRQGVTVDTIKNSLLTSTDITQPYERIYNGNIDHRINIISDECFITLSIDDNKLIQVNPL